MKKYIIVTIATIIAIGLCTGIGIGCFIMTES